MKAHRIGGRVRRDVPTCRLGERVGDAGVRLGDWDRCVVVNEAGVVMGLLRPKHLAASPQAAVEDVMEPGPSTFRPSVEVAEMLAYMEERGMRKALVTTSDGRLLGYFFVEDS